jgi:hypothetical protein
VTIIYTYQKSKKRKPNAKQRQLAQEWQELIAKHAPKKITKVKSISVKLPSLLVPPGRETPSYPSLNSNVYGCGKKETVFYTGDKMKGIGTLHKSNAVPIFTDEEAKDQANMRR